METASPDYLRAIASKHEQIARKLREAADLLEQVTTAQPNIPIERRSEQSQRERELIAYLKEHGPSTADDISRNSPIKLSTIYALCAPKEGKHKWFELDKKTSRISLTTELFPR